MKRILFILATILLLTILVAGCSEKIEEVKTKEEVTISYVKLPLNVPSIIEKKEQLFEKTFNEKGIEVVFSEITEGSKMTEAMASGSLEFSNALGGTSAILAAANGLDIKVIGIYSRAPEAFTLMAKDPELVDIKGLKGKTIVGPKGTILHQLLLSALVEAGLTEADVEFINMGIGDGLVALASDNADVALVAGPAVTKSIENGNHIILTGKGLLDATIVIATSGEMIEKYPEIVSTYMNVHNESLEYMKNNPEKMYEIVSEETGITVDEVKKMYSWYDFSPNITENDILELKKTQDFLIENGMLEKEIEIESMIVDMTK